MEFNRKELKLGAKEMLHANLGTSILVYIVYFAILSVAASTGVGGAIVSGALTVGLALFFMNLSEGKEAKIEDLFAPFNLCFVNSLVASLISGLLVGLGYIVIVPGIILQLEFSLFPFILKERPELGGWEALMESRRMMQGHRWEAFVLTLSFFWWHCLGACTFGLGYIYVGPYIQATMTKYYQFVKAADAAETAA